MKHVQREILDTLSLSLVYVCLLFICLCIHLSLITFEELRKIITVVSRGIALTRVRIQPMERMFICTFHYRLLSGRDTTFYEIVCAVDSTFSLMGIGDSLAGGNTTQLHVLPRSRIHTLVVVTVLGW
jgi:hypothetical protein